MRPGLQQGCTKDSEAQMEGDGESPRSAKSKRGRESN